MNAEELKQLYGNEFPAAVIVNGIRLPLSRETPFSRSYESAEHKRGTVISRFMDGSATITLEQLKRSWPALTQDQRTDFCQACGWVHEHPEFPEMLRFITEQGGPEDWSAVALLLSSRLPQTEAFEILLRELPVLEIGRTRNITQAIAHTKHPAGKD